MGNTAKSAKLVSDIILGNESQKIIVDDKEYVMKPPTIHKIAGAARYLSELEADDVTEVMKKLNSACVALSYLIQGDDRLAEELSGGTLTEVVNGLSVGLRMLSISELDEVVNFGEEVKKDSSSQTIGNDTLVGQIASFMESLGMPYHEVVYKIPYRTLLLMSKDKARVAFGDVYHEMSEEEFFKTRGMKFNK